mmetsp:Transcript_24126/g.78605  ORF Transcript_24126/g.78605 Transcript_24126/m.78605 type:complete len:220 (-) Transcript_24126:186-845(-)
MTTGRINQVSILDELGRLVRRLSASSASKRERNQTQGIPRTPSRSTLPGRAIFALLGRECSIPTNGTQTSPERAMWSDSVGNPSPPEPAPVCGPCHEQPPDERPRSGTNTECRESTQEQSLRFHRPKSLDNQPFPQTPPSREPPPRPSGEQVSESPGWSSLRSLTLWLRNAYHRKQPLFVPSEPTVWIRRNSRRRLSPPRSVLRLSPEHSKLAEEPRYK